MCRCRAPALLCWNALRIGQLADLTENVAKATAATTLALLTAPENLSEDVAQPATALR